MSEPAERPDEYTPFAHEELAKFYEEWPGGLDEIESSLHGWQDIARRLKRQRDEAIAERDAAIKQMQAGWIEVCATPIADLKKENDELWEALREMKELVEFWINREERRGMSNYEYRTWHQLGHGSNAMQRVRALLNRRAKS
jgi:hypothetical protein